MQDAGQYTTVAAGADSYIAVPRGPALRLDHPPCDRQLFTAPAVFKEPEVVAATCRDGYAHVSFADTAIEQRPSRAVLFAAVGAGWHLRAAATGWAGRFRDADFVYFELDGQDMKAPFPGAHDGAGGTGAEAWRHTVHRVWHGDNRGRLEVRADGTADVTNTPGRSARNAQRTRFVSHSWPQPATVLSPRLPKVPPVLRPAAVTCSAFRATG